MNNLETKFGKRLILGGNWPPTFPRQETAATLHDYNNVNNVNHVIDFISIFTANIQRNNIWHHSTRSHRGDFLQIQLILKKNRNRIELGRIFTWNKVKFVWGITHDAVGWWNTFHAWSPRTFHWLSFGHNSVHIRDESRHGRVSRAAVLRQCKIIWQDSFYHFTPLKGARRFVSTAATSSIVQLWKFAYSKLG